ncbi:type II secretion system protein GspM [Pseudomonas sp. R5(2019)]|uniref:type II secretion system protein GspM n=1 Tax=Pseudomonas sp. R5(2019) TaxID=2697566 RepID=UPI0014124BF8|nr:type II secretion system protein GspM [Pseudomonas sp. R5(2019)]NBA97999.1 type II secretion system protein GspM [Pseudomonas sp. R5(2019)]
MIALESGLKSIRELPPLRRGLMLGGCVLVVCLAMYLAVRPMISTWQDARQWRELAHQTSLKPPRPLNAERLQTLAAARQIVLTRVEQVEGRWQLQGELDQALGLQQLMRAVQEQGAVVEQWHLSRQHKGLSFRLQVADGAVRP